MKRPSLPITPEELAALDLEAARLGCMFRGKPSWRTLVRWIATGKVRCQLSSKGEALALANKVKAGAPIQPATVPINPPSSTKPRTPVFGGILHP